MDDRINKAIETARKEAATYINPALKRDAFRKVLHEEIARLVKEEKRTEARKADKLRAQIKSMRAQKDMFED